ncbi:MAG: GNAT family N-acetyltransferase [Pseudomonadales bacterium]|nr:GNAT family N-acetyltransferase [Pseudomonadales bacterium]
METLDYHPIRIDLVPWEQAAPSLRAIRHAVFVVEQGIAAAMEFGDPAADARARHWLATTENGEPAGCVRRLDDRLGRLAVLPAQRHQGIGAALVRRVIRDALEHGLPGLYLHAQSQTRGFYERLGFVAEGEEFIEAGLPHLRMALDLERLRPGREVPLSDIDPADRQRQILEGSAALASWSVQLIPLGLRRLRVLSTALAPEIYDSDAVRDALLAFATSHPQAQVQVLVREPAALVQGKHRLVALAQRLPSLVRLRELPPGSATPDDELLVTDHGGLLRWSHGRPPRGYGIRHAPREARQLAEAFDELWGQSREIAELRTLSL